MLANAINFNLIKISTFFPLEEKTFIKFESHKKSKQIIKTFQLLFNVDNKNVHKYN